MYAFEYTITIENLSQSEVQLHSRHWIINDALHIPKVVKGPGVVGLQPLSYQGDKTPIHFRMCTSCTLWHHESYY